MKIEIEFTEDEGRNILWLLREHYQSKASLTSLADQAVRDMAALAAREMLDNLEKEVKEREI